MKHLQETRNKLKQKGRLSRECVSHPFERFARIASVRKKKGVQFGNPEARSDFLFPLQPPPTSHPNKPPSRPTPESLIWVYFGSVSVCFGSVWLRLAPFRVCFGSVSGPFRGVGWGRGGVGESGFCNGKEYHYLRRFARTAKKRAPTNLRIGSRESGHLSSKTQVSVTLLKHKSSGYSYIVKAPRDKPEEPATGTNRTEPDRHQ